MAVKIGLIFISLFSIILSKKLVQVVMLSRHNVRTPLMTNLEHFSPKTWPSWTDEPGFLTAKGALLEEYMGEYIKQWLVKERLLTENCPMENDIHFYANTRHRTRESAKAFARGAFKNCSVKVNVINSEDMDPVFNPIIRNTSIELKTELINEMQEQLDKLQLTDAYILLENILDLSNSEVCKDKSVCSFANVKDDIFYEIGEEPNLKGPLQQGNSIVDSFIMSYYEGMSSEKVAWGEIQTPDQWKSLAKITKENQNVRFNSTKLAKEVSKPMVDYIRTLFLKENPPKFSLLHGHDANLNSVMAAMRFKGYSLPEQYETTPLGGKLVWQKWHDHELDKDFLKVVYIYQSVHQLTEGLRLSDENPPLQKEMEIIECPIDEDGYCLWDDFEKILVST